MWPSLLGSKPGFHRTLGGLQIRWMPMDDPALRRWALRRARRDPSRELLGWAVLRHLSCHRRISMHLCSKAQVLEVSIVSHERLSSLPVLSAWSHSVLETQRGKCVYICIDARLQESPYSVLVVVVLCSLLGLDRSLSCIVDGSLILESCE